jgi:hypothetical protein
VTPLFSEVAQLGDAAFERAFLAGERCAKLFLSGEGDFGFGEGGMSDVALLAKLFESGGEGGESGLAFAFADFQGGSGIGEDLAFAGAFLFLGGEALDFEDDGLDFLFEEALGVLEGLKFTLTGGDGNFLGAKIGLGLLEAGLDLGLFGGQGAFLASGFGDLILELGGGGLEFGDLVFASENGGGGLAAAVAVQVAAGENAVAIEEFAGGGDKIVEAESGAGGFGGGGEVRGNEGGAKEAAQKGLNGVIGGDDG